MADIAKYEPVSDDNISQHTEDLPSLLLSYLERQFYEDFGSHDFKFANHQGGEPALHSRFIEIKEVKHTANLERSFHPYNMQNVVSSLSSGNYGLAYVIRNVKDSTRLYMGVRQIDREAIDPEYQVNVLMRALESNYPGIIANSDFERHVGYWRRCNPPLFLSNRTCHSQY